MNKRCVTAVIAAVMCWADAAALAQAADTPGTQACRDPQLIERLQRARSVQPAPAMLFDGTTPLAGTPVVAARIAPTLMPVIPACVLLSVTFADHGGTLSVDQVGYLGASGRSAQLVPRYGAPLLQAGTDALRELLRQNLLPVRPQAGVRFLVAVPVDPAHPLYREPAAPVASAPVAGASAGGTAATAGASLAARGYADAHLLAEVDGVQLHRIAQAQDRYWFAMVRRVAPDEPLLDYDGAAQPGGAAVLGPVARQRLERMVLPYVRDTGARQVTIEVRHYAQDASIEYRANSSYVNNEQRQHPTVGRTVEIPVAIERWTGTRAGSGGPYTWVSDGGFYTPYSAHNTVAAIQGAQATIATSQAANESARTQRDTDEIARVRAARAAMAAREQAKPARYAAAKLSYRPASDWSGYDMARALRAVHDGHYPEARRDWIFGRVYFHAVATYGDRCRSLLPAGSAVRTTTWYYEDPHLGMQKGREEKVYIHRDFVRVFEGWKDRKPGMPALYPPTLGQVNPMQDLRGAMAPGFEVQRVAKALRADFARMFEQSCTAPAITQFMENLRRLGDGVATLQAERVPDLLPQPGDAPTTVAEGCTQYDRDRGAPRNGRWCDCLDRVLTPRYSAEDLVQRLENYSRFIEQASYPRGGDARARAHPDYVAAAVCRK